MILGVSLISSWVGGGKSTLRTTMPGAGFVGIVGIVARAKNWFCADAQTTLLLPSRYSACGVLGKMNRVVVLVLKKEGITFLTLAPSYQRTASSRALSCGPIGVAVPMDNSRAGRDNCCPEPFLI